ncbi:MAG: hypothetical protein DRP11_03115, partial [Candidatus Aenigmatarchaeota archaeon]
GTPTQGTCSITYHSFTCQDQGLNQYLFQIQDSEPSNTYNTSIFTGPDLTQSQVQIFLVQGDNSEVNRSSGTTPLTIRIFDIENNTNVSNANATIWVTYDFQNYDPGYSGQTSSGIFTRNFDPTCSPVQHLPGIQTWIGGVHNDACYIDTNLTQNYSVTVYADLNNTVLIPTNGQTYLNGTNVTINVTVQDDCSNYISSVSINISYISLHTGESFNCTPVNDRGNGYYDCEFNTTYPTVLPPRGYNISVNTSKDLYNRDEHIEYNAFFIETRPILENPRFTTADGTTEFGQQFNFSVNLTDYDLDVVNVYFYIRQQGDVWGSPQVQQVSGINRVVTFTKTFTCGDLSPNPTWEYYFEAIDNRSYSDQTEVNNLTLEKDPVEFIHNAGNNTIVHRIDNTTFFSVQLKDAKLGTVLASTLARSYVTTDGITYIQQDSKLTDSNGNFNTTFNPSCPTYNVGIQRWKVNITEQTCTKASNSEEYFVIIYSNMTLHIERPFNESALRGIESIFMRGNVTDECNSPITDAEVTFAIDTPSYYTCPSTENEGYGWYNCTVPAGDTTTFPLQWHNASINASRSYYYPNSRLETDRIFIASEPFLSNPDVTPQAEGWAKLFNFTVDIQDPDNNTVYVSLWKTKNQSAGWEYVNTSICYYCADTQTMVFEEKFPCDDVGTWYYKFNATDTWNYNDSITGLSTFDIEKDDVILYYRAGNMAGTESIPREGNVTWLLSVQVYDTDNESWLLSGRNGSFYITTDHTNYDSGHRVTTDENGYLNFSFDPDGNYSVGIQYWYARTEDDACYQTQPSGTFQINITGQLKNFIEYPEFNITIPVGNIFNITVNVTTDNSTLLSGAKVSIRLRDPLDTWYSCNPTPSDDRGDGYYTCTFNSTGVYGGYWDIEMESHKANYFYNYTLFEDWFYLRNTPPNVTNVTFSPTVGGWGEVYTFTVTLEDIQNDDVNCSLYISSDNATWQYRGSSILPEGNGNCTVNVTDFTCAEMGQKYFLFQIDDGTPENLKNTSSYLGPYIDRDNITIEYIQGNWSIANRSNNQYTTFILRVFDNDTGNYTPAGVNTSIWVTYNITHFDSGHYLQTNDSGYITYEFNPNCTPLEYKAGTQYWFGGVNDGCYEELNTTNFTTFVYGDLISTIDQPTGNKYLRGTTIALRASILDDCSNSITDAQGNFTVVNEDGTSYDCGETSNVGANIYGCDWNSTNKKARWYDIIFNSSRQYYNPDNITEENGFYLETEPVVTNMSVTPEIGGWGERFYFRGILTDEDLDNVTVVLQLRGAGGIFTDYNTTFVESPVNHSIELSTRDFTCGDLLSNPWEYRFKTVDNATNGPYITYSDVNNFTIEEDDVQFTVLSGNGAFLWRNGTNSTVMKVHVYDIDAENDVFDGTTTRFWITTDGTNYDSGHSSSTSSGNTSYTFDPTCTPVKYETGPQNWVVGTYGNDCYKDENSTPYSIEIWSNISSEVVEPDGESYIAGTDVNISTRVRDDCDYLEGATVTINLENGAFNRNYNPSSEGSGWYNMTFNQVTPRRWYNITVTASKSYYITNSTKKVNAFFYATIPVLSDEYVDHDIGGWGETYNFYVTVLDQDQDLVNLTLWKSFDGTNWTSVHSENVTGDGLTKRFTITFNCSDIGLNYWKFNASDPWGYSDETSIHNITLDPDNSTIQVTN